MVKVISSDGKESEVDCIGCALYQGKIKSIGGGNF